MNHDNVIYLDNASTTFPTKECINEFLECANEYYNPASTYCTGGIDAHNKIEKARKKIAKFINANPSEIYFTSGGSEANSWAIKGIVEANDIDTIITTPIEHSSVNNAIKQLSETNPDMCVFETPIDNYGNVEIKAFENMIGINKGRKILVAIMFANNEIGTVQRISDLSYITKQYEDTWFFTDAVQAFGNININMKNLECVDMLSASGHKIGCFSGIGFLYVKSGTNIAPLINGGKQERGLRGGTENYCYIVPFGNQVARVQRGFKNRWSDLANKSYYLYKKIFDGEIANYCDLRLNGNSIGDYERLPNNLSIVFGGINSDIIINLLDERGFIVSYGSACNAGTGEPSKVLKAIGLSDEEASSTIRISINQYITFDDLSLFYENLLDIVKFIGTPVDEELLE